MGSVGLWVGLRLGSKFSLWYGLGWVEQIGPTHGQLCLKPFQNVPKHINLHVEFQFLASVM